jgi:N-methylhydantoinase B
MKLDAVTLEVLRNALPAVANEMAADLQRTSYNMMIYEVRDYCTALLDTNGELISQNVGGVSHFVADLGVLVVDGMKRYGRDGFKPGDVVITNHQAVAGQHLNNVVIYMPYFYRGELLMFCMVRAHWIDVGGQSTGFGAGATVADPWLEGLQLDQLKIYEEGKLNETLYGVVARRYEIANGRLSPCRAPHGRAVRQIRQGDDPRRHFANLRRDRAEVP